MDGRKITLLDAYKMWRLYRGLEGLRVATVYRSGECLSARLRGSAGEAWLLFHPRVGPVVVGDRVELEEPYTPVKRGLKGRRVAETVLVGGDRVFALRCGGAELVLEWVREGNILLLEDGVIRYALRRRRLRDRAVEPGERYLPPPRQASIFEVAPEEVASRVAASRRRLVTAFATAAGIPGELSYEALYRAGLDPMAKPGSADSHALAEAYWAARSIYIESLESPRGYLVGGHLYPFMPTHRAEPIREVTYIDEAPGYFAGIIRELCSKPVEEVGLGERLAESLRRIEAEIHLLQENKARVEAIISEYTGLRAQRVPWSEIDSALSSRYPEYRGAEHRRWLLKLVYSGTQLEVDARGGFYRSLEARYNALKRLRERISRIPQRAPQEHTEEDGEKEKRKRRWYEDFRYFTTTGGFLVVAGKSAGQNELLVRRYLEENDIFMHADIHGAPATILKTRGAAPSEKDLEEAAQFAASYSSAWEAGLYAVDVYWVWGRQVSKKAPSGEYLGKGAFMVYGKRNYLRRVKLSLAVGYSPGEGLIALPALALGERRGCYLVLEPGRLSRRLLVDKVLRLLRRECGLKRLQSGDVEKLLPRGGFYIARRVVRP